MSSISRWLSALCLWFAGTGLVLMSGIIIWQVFARYVLNASPSWSEQSALFLMIWTVLFAAAAGIREGFHIRITFAVNALGQAPQKLALTLSHLIVGIIGVFMVINGIDLVIRTWEHTIPTLGLPRGAAYIPLPVAGAMIAFFSAEKILNLFADKETDPVWN